MQSIRRQTDVDAPLRVVEENWPHFVRWVLTGHARLACDELACVDAVRAGQVKFEERSEGVTRIIFELEADDAPGLPLDEIDRMVTRDLITFSDYLKRNRREQISDRGGLGMQKDVHAAGGPREKAGSGAAIMFWRR